MQSWLPILIILQIGLCWFIWLLYGRLLRNKMVFVKRINQTENNSLGDIKVSEGFIQVKFLWSTKTFSLNQINQIKAYAQTDWGLEEHEYVDVLFDNNDKITFSGSSPEQRELVQQITQELGIADKVWNWGELPQLCDWLGRDIVFDKNESH